MAWFLIPGDDPFQEPPPPTELNSTTADGNAAFSRGDVLRDYRFYCLTLVYLFLPVFVTGLFINQHLLGEADAFGWSEKSLAIGLSVFGGSRLVGNILSGPLIDRFTARSVFRYMLVPMMIGLVPLLFTDHILAFWVFMAGSGIAGALSSLSSTAAWAELYGTTHLGSIRSMVSTVMVFGTAVAPVATSYLFADRDIIYLTWWGTMGIMMGLTVLGFWVIRQPAKAYIR